MKYITFKRICRSHSHSQAEIKESMFVLCGIAQSNKAAPALITACMGVSMCRPPV